ncbi:unnamed protein product [Oikopleura dioica]|nr:unnamed protein product [Oikopleura dioica]
MMLPGSATQPMVFAAACKCPRRTNPRVCGWWGRKFSTTTALAQADLDVITCIAGTSTTAAPTTTSAAQFSRKQGNTCDAIILLNTYRANHNADPFVIPSAALCAGAQAWADSEAANNENGLPGSTPSMMHSAGDDRPGEGENIAWSSAGTLTLSEATTMWQSEDAYWDFTNHKNLLINFKQKLIKATTSVCVAKAVNGAGTFVVARYEPGGTWWKSGIYMNSMTTQIDGGGPLDGNYVGTVHVPST